MFPSPISFRVTVWIACFLMMHTTIASTAIATASVSSTTSSCGMGGSSANINNEGDRACSNPECRCGANCKCDPCLCTPQNPTCGCDTVASGMSAKQSTAQAREASGVTHYASSHVFTASSSTTDALLRGRQYYSDQRSSLSPLQSASSVTRIAAFVLVPLTAVVFAAVVATVSKAAKTTEWRHRSLTIQHFL